VTRKPAGFIPEPDLASGRRRLSVVLRRLQTGARVSHEHD